ncbi:MAG: hypothetical protein DMG80_12915 [Acidobacteria bacterium]|nr:MAG: hypothetical protein DMG80_12915 [Acidobacteriota bacterium]
MIFTSTLKTLSASLLALLFVLSAASFDLQAQVTGGTISGTVVDTSGRVIANCTIAITNSETGIARNVTTNSDGFYTAPNLTAGSYDLSFAAPGFKTDIRKGIALTVGASTTLDLTMQVGTTIETVQVQTEAPAVQLTTSDIGAVVNATTVRELPLNGRSWTDLAALQPGVDTIHTQPDFSAGTDRGNRGFGQQLTISGARPQQNNYRLDGVSINDYANGSPGSVLGGSLGVDAIQEFSVLTSNYSAEYGKTSGGVVNAITRSGTNQFHGSAYEFLRNAALDARNYFDVGNIPPFKRNQFGGSIGGPIIKSRTFFFADFEAIRQSKGLTSTTFVPSENARNGLLCQTPQPTDTCTPHTVIIDPSAAAYLTFYHPPNPNSDPLGNGDTAIYSFAGQQIVNENFFTTRIDHTFSPNDALFGTYLFDRTPYSSPDGTNNVLYQTKTSRQIFALEETHTFAANFVNSVRIGWNHEAVNNNQNSTAINPDATRTDLGSFPGRAAAQVLVGGLTDFTGGVGGSPTYLYHWNTGQIYDDAFFTKGTHAIRFGIALERQMLNQVADTDPNGIWNFGSLDDFFGNTPGKFQGGLHSTLSPRNLRQTIFGAYLQDDWRLRSNLTVNLGLRYEMSTVPTETAGKLANLRNITDAAPHLGNPFFNNPTLRNFEPRVGFAWDPFNNGKTAIRGGVGMFDVLPLLYQFILLTNQASPFFQYTIIKDPFGFCECSAPFFSLGGKSDFPANRLRTTFVEPNPKRNYVMQWNLNVQQQLTPTLSAMVAYVGSRGIHQPFRVDDANLAIPTKTQFGYLWPVDAQILNDNFGSIRGMFYNGHSYFNALETQVAKRMSHGVQMQGTFTWGKSMDTSSATVAGDSFGNSISSLHYFDPRLSRALSDFNVGRTLVINGTWELPGPKSTSLLAQNFLGGWQLGLIFTASDGVPVTPTWGTGDDPALTQSGDDWAFPNRLGGPGCKSLVNTGNPNGYIKVDCFAIPTVSDQAFWQANCFHNPDDPTLPPFPQCFNLRGNAGRNIINGPGVTELDFSVFKNNYIKRISERFNIQFRAEIFNILNHANFAPPTTPTNTDIFNSSGDLQASAGVLTKTTTTAREVQFAIKVIF